MKELREVSKGEEKQIIAALKNGRTVRSLQLVHTQTFSAVITATNLAAMSFLSTFTNYELKTSLQVITHHIGMILMAISLIIALSTLRPNYKPVSITTALKPLPVMNQEEIRLLLKLTRNVSIAFWFLCAGILVELLGIIAPQMEPIWR
jgi:hypothetical protein